MPVNQAFPSSYEANWNILASKNYTPASYTLDATYVTPVSGVDSVSRKVLRSGQVMALNPVSGKVVPNYTSYGFGVVGPLLQTAVADNGDVDVAIVFEGNVKEALCKDNGTFGTVLAATKTALAGRVNFLPDHV